MIRSFTAHTYEIDDVEKAASEIKGQVTGLLANTVGILVCQDEFVLSGAAKAVCAAVPFPVVGTVSIAMGVKEGRGNMLLALLVLTSDEARFGAACSDTLIDDPEGAVERAYAAAASGFEGKPALCLTFAAFLPQNVGDEYVETLTRVSNGAPVFGTLAVDDSVTFDNSLMIFNGESYRDRLGLILVYGDIDPKFYVATVSDDHIVKESPALITKSERHILKEVNGRPLHDFFEELGLTKASETSYALSTIPFMVDYGDGTEMGSKVFISLTPERYGVFAGAMPEGATMYMGTFDKADVLHTTGAAMKAAAEAKGGAMLVYTCLSRYMTMGTDPFAEMDLALGATGRPCLVAYSGGEICPTGTGAEGIANHFHNNALIVCVF